MTLQLAIGSNNLPVLSRASSFTRLAGGSNDPFQALKQDINEIALHPVRAAITRLLSRNDNWDGFGSVRPNMDAVQNALSLISSLYVSALRTQLPWIQPHVASSEEGDVVFEWWSGPHKLTVYVGSDSCEYVQVWGSDINTQMKDGSLSDGQFQGLWRWLLA